jgi:diketogulonate reductase-like aldo/keto reductase
VRNHPAADQIEVHPYLTPDQVVLRWHIERGDIVFPQVGHPGPDKFNPCNQTAAG